MKYDSEKSRVDLIPSDALLEVGQVLRFGATKYGENNWKGLDNGRERYIGAALRHIYQRDEIVDRESKLLHLAHAASNILFALHLTLNGD